jgi:hypothetical protein
LATDHQDLQPVKARHKDWSPAGRIEGAPFDAFQVLRFAGTHRTQTFRLQALWLF